LDAVEGSGPAGFVEEVDELVDGGLGLIGQGFFFDAGVGNINGPVDEERAADDVLSRDKAPEAAVHAVGAVVAHDEVVAGRDDEIFALHVVWEVDGPHGGDVGLVRGCDGRKIVDVGVVSVGRGLGGLRLVLCDAVEVDDAVAEVDAVTGDADEALDEGDVFAVGFRYRLEEDDYVATARIALMDEGRPARGR